MAVKWYLVVVTVVAVAVPVAVAVVKYLVIVIQCYNHYSIMLQGQKFNNIVTGTNYK